MSVLVSARIAGDTAKFRQLMESDPDRFRQLAEQAKSAGAIHHRFAVGDGYVLVIDEWETAEAFQQFFQNPAIGAIIADAGGTGQPDIVIAEAIESPDQF
jgi:hypothetical protein